MSSLIFNLILNSSIPIYRGLKYQTRWDFEWSKFIWMLNSLDFEWYSKTEQPNYFKSDQTAPPSWIPMYWFCFWWLGTKAVAMVPIILIRNHPESKLPIVWISNGFWILAPTVPVQIFRRFQCSLSHMTSQNVYKLDWYLDVNRIAILFQKFIIYGPVCNIKGQLETGQVKV